MDDLHHLIRELAPNEKRYIKRQAGETEGRLLALFDAIRAQQSPDEDRLREHFGAQGWFNNFSEAKRRLTGLVLRGLRRFNETRSPKFEILNLLADVETLYHKEQDHLLAQRLDKARQQAAAADLPELELLALSWYPRLAMRFLPAREQLPACAQRRRELTGMLRPVAASWHLSGQTHRLYRAYGYPCSDAGRLQELAAAISRVRASLPPGEQHFMVTYVIDFCDFMFHLMANRINDAYLISCRTLQHSLSQAKTFQAEKLFTIINTFQAQTGLSMELQWYPQVIAHLDDFQQFFNQPHLKTARKPLEKYARILIAYYRVSASMYLGRATITEKAVEGATAQLKHLKQDPSWHIFLRLRIAMAALSLGQFARAKALIVALQERTDVRPDVQNLLLMLRFMVDYELANFDQAGHLYRQGLRRLLRVGLDIPQDRRLLVYFRRLMTEREMAQIHLLELEQFLNEILASPQRMKTTSEIQFLLAWVESKLANRPLIDQFRLQQAAGNQAQPPTSS